MADNSNLPIVRPPLKAIRVELKTAVPPAPRPLAELVMQWEAADSEFAAAIHSGATPTQALGSLGVQLFLQDRLPESLSVLNAGLAESPDDLSLLNNLAVVLERSEQTAQAIEKVQRSLTLSPQQADSWIFLGNLKQKQGDLHGAVDAYRSAVAWDTAHVPAWQCLGVALEKQCEFTDAIECFRMCIRLNQATAPVLSMLGRLHYSTGEFVKSRDAYSAAVDSDPTNAIYCRMLRETRFICSMMNGADIEDVINRYLVDHAGFSIEQDLDDLLQRTFAQLSAYGFNASATMVAEKRLALFPTSATARYFVQAMLGDQAITRSPDQFIVETFDKMAEHFDEHLVRKLSYDIPQKLGAALISQIPADAKLDILDAGCGTGLCAPHIRSFAQTLTGVDLSPKMLAQARSHPYDLLVCSELTSYLNDLPEAFDAIIAADVVIYFGDLAPLAAAMARCLRPDGLLAFSTECGDNASYQLLPSGRFVHDPAYVREVFGVAFVECICETTTLRTEATRAVPGNLFVFRKR